MSEIRDWRPVHDFWFPPELDETDTELHRRLCSGDPISGQEQFAPLISAGVAGQLDHWLEVPAGRVTLILVLDQISRRLLFGQPEMYAADPKALLIAEEGLCIGHYDPLKPWEKLSYLLPLIHAEGPGHRERLERCVALLRAIEAPEPSRPVYDFLILQATGQLDTIIRFGRFPHRNEILGRASTAEEAEYIRKGDFVHLRKLPEKAGG